ncbi:MAG: LysM peptidoglycan-binding domain-containing protein [Pseudomonadota bacterium]|nr:LysM peptidoglycan-binding domain-containing protein [Pseudomonadota bacterium]
MKFKVKNYAWILVVGVVVSCSAAQTDSDTLQVGNETAVDDVVGTDVVGSGGEYNQMDNGQLIGAGNTISDANLNQNIDAGNVIGGDNVADMANSAQEIDAVAGSDTGNVLSNAASSVGEIEPQQSENLYGNDQTNLGMNNDLNMGVTPPSEVPMDDGESTAMASSDAAMMSGDMGGLDAGTMTASLPEMGAKMVYIVKSGDTLGDIAQNIYGDKSRWHDLASWSGFANPHLIFPGDVVYYQYTQESAAFAANYEAQQRMDEVVVQAGDSLSKIAARVYGNPMAWVVLWRHNGHVANPDVIQIGMKVHYPANNFLVADAHSTQQAAPAAAIDQADQADQADQYEQLDQADQVEGQVATQAPDQIPAAG